MKVAAAFDLFRSSLGHSGPTCFAGAMDTMLEHQPSENVAPNSPNDGPSPAEPATGAPPELASAAPAGVADKAPNGSPPQPGPVAASAFRTAAAWCLGKCRHLARGLWRYLGDVARYYWNIRQPLWEYIAGFAPNLMSESVRLREVRLAPYESHSLAEYDAQAGWTVAVPGRCVVCGEKTANLPLDEKHSIDDAARAFWVPVASVLVGVPLGLFVFGRWSILFVIPLGFALAYLVRGIVPVRLRVARCEQHATRTNVPRILSRGNTLVLRFGNKLVRKAFLYGETADSVVPQPDARAADSSPHDYGEPAPYVPETIPLAEGPSPENSTIRHEQPLSFRPDDEDRSTPAR